MLQRLPTSIKPNDIKVLRTIANVHSVMHDNSGAFTVPNSNKISRDNETLFC